MRFQGGDRVEPVEERLKRRKDRGTEGRSEWWVLMQLNVDSVEGSGRIMLV